MDDEVGRVRLYYPSGCWRANDVRYVGALCETFSRVLSSNEWDQRTIRSADIAAKNGAPV